MDKRKNDCYKIMFDAILEGYALLRLMRDTDNMICDCTIIEINEQFKAITGIADQEVIGKTIRKVLPSLDENWIEFSKNIPQADENIRSEFYLENIDRHFFISMFKPSDDEAVLLFNEITLQKKAKDVFRIHEVLFENAQDIMLYVKLDGKIVNANKRASEQYGYTKQQLLSMRIQDIRHPSTVTEYEHQMQQAYDGGITFECIHVRSDGSSFPVEVSAKTTYTEKGKFRIHIIRDITKRKESEEKIAWLARHDVLTGIANRASFIMHLEEEIKRSLRNKTQFAVMLFDIDKFKHINDHYGHEAGDEALRHVAKEAQKVLRATDQIGRFGGDEFVVLQTDIKDQNDITALAERILSAVNKKVPYKGTDIRIKTSIGICLFPEDAADANGLLHCADNAMYRIKRKGGGGYVFFDDAGEDNV